MRAEEMRHEKIKSDDEVLKDNSEEKTKLGEGNIELESN